MTALTLAGPRVTVVPALPSPARWRLRRRHMLMLALAVEILVFGVQGAGRYRAPGIGVNLPNAAGNVIT